MGTLNTFDFEGTPGNTVAGTNIALQGVGSAVYDVTQAVVGSTGALFTATNGNARVARLTWTATSKTFVVEGFLRTPTVLPGAGVRYTFATVRRSGGVVISVQVDQNGQVGVEGTSSGFLAVSATGIPVSTMLRIVLRLVVGITTNDGDVVAKVFTSANNFTTQSGSTLIRGPGTSNGIDLGTAVINAGDFGASSSVTPGLIVGVDHVRAEDGRTTDFGLPEDLARPALVMAARSWAYGF